LPERSQTLQVFLFYFEKTYVECVEQEGYKEKSAKKAKLKVPFKVVLSYAVVEPLAMVVHQHHTPTTFTAVMHKFYLFSATFSAGVLVCTNPLITRVHT
jgi:hypothetical protein